MAFLDEGQLDFERLRSYLRRNFDSPEQLQALYDHLPDAMRQQLEAQVELWSIEGGLGLGGGLRSALSGPGGSGGVFRLSFSGGVVWPFGGFDLPIYYIFTDIPGPWAVGFMGYAHTDNFSTATAGLNLRVAVDYLGTSPFLEIGPAARVAFKDGDLAPGVHLDLGYGNILIQGFVQAEVFADEAQTLTIIAGLRVPWLLFSLF